MHAVEHGGGGLAGGARGSRAGRGGRVLPRCAVRWGSAARVRGAGGVGGRGGDAPPGRRRRPQMERDDRGHLRGDVRGHPLARGRRIARADRGEDRAVVGQRAAGAVLAGGEPHERARLRLQVHLRAREPERPRRRRHLDVEARVGGAPLGRGLRARQPLDVLRQPRDVRLRRARGRQLGRRARDRRAVVGQVAQLVHAQLRQPLEQPRVRRLGRRVHERAAGAPAPGLHQAGPPQPLERLAQGDRRHAELRRQLRLGGQLVAVAEHADADRVGQPPLDLRHPPARVERSEHGAARARRQMARHRG